MYRAVDKKKEFPFFKWNEIFQKFPFFGSIKEIPVFLPKKEFLFFADRKWNRKFQKFPFFGVKKEFLESKKKKKNSIFSCKFRLIGMYRLENVRNWDRILVFSSADWTILANFLFFRTNFLFFAGKGNSFFLPTKNDLGFSTNFLFFGTNFLFFVEKGIPFFCRLTCR